MTFVVANCDFVVLFKKIPGKFKKLFSELESLTVSKGDFSSK